jgi:primary-amine oxidase
MTDTAVRSAKIPGPVPAHPLDPASAEEFLAGRRILAEAGLLTETVRFAYYGLEEPPKDDVLGLAGRAGTPPDRRLRAFLIDVVSGQSSDVIVSLTDGKVTSRRTLDPHVDGQPPILDQDFALAEKVVHADPEWRAAMAPAWAHRRLEDPCVPADGRVLWGDG